MVEVAKGPENGQFKKLTFYTGPKQQYFCEKLSSRFSRIRLHKGELVFGFLDNFLQKKTFFLTLNLKFVNSISSSFDQPVQRPIHYFSQTSTQMVPPGNSQFWGPKSKKITFYTGPEREKLSTRFSNIQSNKSELLFGFLYLFLRQQKKLRPKIQIWEIGILGLKFLLDSEPQIGRQHFFIIWPTGQTANQLFFANVYQNGIFKPY